ncbi:putative mitochondrial acyl carrier protein, putative (ACP) [Leptomonas pyrrhocoris]|uniref:Acyl carrier protein n=1 Tax=Leptomonas pyrrhocoris TaxID=157538 RepID=A0A0N0DQU3_LEPPY|nr:putative mitochondrial acyl carrier protein, putative (ACP) [Leptomonas pyrrhocoris]XP_015651954.1 putative mitochondrial acyl carrier protein, putative (ACP) [Leptomonas pyrrhocoris]KPA73514.1 putative mitochondrial acyl carrier protein, putative (ACP) [Leptomonas pyrrhocoris]KPA73515.1 putative mitochondrial acyl carrier protein, putative (ACP) [Leptomonas pyrrhocoris]|eukprot:XP_015651953.1 putative mitochondrial acyl carrier protein, putative (ACP) [Leptomonas pyrrhocoris]
MQRAFLRRLSKRAVVPATAALLRFSQTQCAGRAPVTACAGAVLAYQCSIRAYSDAHHEESATRSGQYLLDKNDVLTRVLEVVKNFEKVDASKVTPESHFVNDLGLNSLDVVEVVFAIEQEFILDIPDHDAEKIQSIPDAVEYIAQNPMAK